MTDYTGLAAELYDEFWNQEELDDIPFFLHLAQNAEGPVLDAGCGSGRVLLPLAQAVSRVFARLGEKQSRARARIKFLVQKLGIDEFKKLVAEEREGLRPDPRWTAFLDDLHATDEKPIREAGPLPADAPAGFQKWAEHNLKPQAQDGYHSAIVKLPLGDFTSAQGRALADIAREFTGDAIRCTVEQNLTFR